MDQNQVVWNEKVAEKIIKNLKKRRMDGSYAATAAQAKDEVVQMISPGSTVLRCGTMTATGIGLWEAIGALPGVNLIDPYEQGISPHEGLERRRQGMIADVMIASTNAITLDGRLVNLDGMGNRVAAMAFGPRKVILLAGMNKVAADLESAMARVKHYSAPVNNIRYGFSNPCVETGLCSDCKSPTRICNMWSIIEGHMIEKRIHVKMIGEVLGY
ncbi:MAG: lactate utilization protein [Desulfobacterales bacterium]